MAKTNPLIAFYREDGQDDAGRTLAEIFAWDNDALESVHDFIQWLFPLPERSGANPAAPVLDEATVAAFHATPAMRERLHRSYERLLRFYGLRWTGDTIERTPQFPARAQNWLRPMNHNHLRLTRILRSLRLLELTVESAALWRALESICTEFPDRVTAQTRAFWSATQRQP